MKKFTSYPNKPYILFFICIMLMLCIFIFNSLIPKSIATPVIATVGALLALSEIYFLEGKGTKKQQITKLRKILRAIRKLSIIILILLAWIAPQSGIVIFISLLIIGVCIIITAIDT